MHYGVANDGNLGPFTREYVIRERFMSGVHSTSTVGPNAVLRAPTP